MKPSLVVASKSANPTIISIRIRHFKQADLDRAQRFGARAVDSLRPVYSTKSSSTARPTIAKQKLIMKIAW